MLSIQFDGRSAVESVHLGLPTHTLNRIESKSFGGQVSQPGNMVIHGDNLLALKALVQEFAGRVKCVYIDPPYNTGNDHWIFNDNMSSESIEQWLVRTVGEEAKHFSRHDKWLCMMLPRLQLLHQLLADDGVLMVSIDDIEQANLRVLLDEVFGADNFVANLVWNSPADRVNRADTDASNEHEYVVVYAKNRQSKTLYAHNGGKAASGWRYATDSPTVIGEGIYTDDGGKELKDIFGDKTFDYPKPSALVTLLLEKVTHKDSIVLDCFAGTGTTAEAVLRLNKADGGTRRFILVEVGVYADSITAERIRRVSAGVAGAKDPLIQQGLGGTFDYFELSESIK